MKERGAVSVMAIGVGVLLIAIVMAIMEFAVVVRARHTAAAAADLAALAASAAVEAGDDGCAVAERIAAANGAQVIACRLDAAVATITTRVVQAHRWWGGGWQVSDVARAAPASYLDS